MARVALAQLNQGSDVDLNYQKIEEMTIAARQRGASLICLPENCVYFGTDTVAISEAIPGPLLSRYTRLAQSQSMWMSLGGFPEKCESDARKYHNTHLIINSDGIVAGSYRKLHLFDVNIDPPLRESDRVSPGDIVAAVVPSPIGNLGLSICYDLRFPELYRKLSLMGAEVVLVPSAFLEKTGYAHWEPLLRARAIENQCYVVAAAMVGRHNERRVSYGHSCVVDPWGVVVGECSDEERLLVADIDLAYLHSVRSKLPALTHRRADVFG